MKNYIVVQLDPVEVGVGTLCRLVGVDRPLYKEISRGMTEELMIIADEMNREETN